MEWEPKNSIQHVPNQVLFSTFWITQYNIPSNTTAGAYQVVFFDNVSQTNVSIPITISAAPVTPTSSAAVPSGSSGTNAATTSVPASIFNKDSSSANAGVQISMFLLVSSLFVAFVQL